MDSSSLHWSRRPRKVRCPLDLISVVNGVWGSIRLLMCWWNRSMSAVARAQQVSSV